MKKNSFFGLLASVSVFGVCLSFGGGRGFSISDIDLDSETSSRSSSSLMFEASSIDIGQEQFTGASLNKLAQIIQPYTRNNFDCRKFLKEYGTSHYAVGQNITSFDPNVTIDHSPDFMVLQCWEVIEKLENTPEILEGQNKHFLTEVKANLLLTHKIFPLFLYEDIDDENPQECREKENGFIGRIIDNLAEIAHLRVIEKDPFFPNAPFKLVSQAFIYVGQLNLLMADRTAITTSKNNRIRDAFNSFRHAIAFQEKHNTTKLPYLLAIHTMLKYGAHTSNLTNQETIQKFLKGYWEKATEVKNTSPRDHYTLSKTSSQSTDLGFLQKHSQVKHVSKSLKEALEVEDLETESFRYQSERAPDITIDEDLENGPAVYFERGPETVVAPTLHPNPNSLPHRIEFVNPVIPKIKQGESVDSYFNYKDQFFRLQNVSGKNNDCFFNATGLVRNAQVKLLIDNLQDPIVNQMVQNEMKQANFQGTCKYYIQQKIAGTEMMILLSLLEFFNKSSGEHININPNQYLVTNAIAYLNNFGLRGYIRDPHNPEDLVLQHEFIPENATSIAHLFHEGAHFQALLPFESGHKRSLGDSTDDDMLIPIKKRIKKPTTAIAHSDDNPMNNDEVSLSEQQVASDSLVKGAKHRTHYELPTEFPESPSEEDFINLTESQIGGVRAKYRSDALAFILTHCGFQAEVETTANSELRRGVRSYSQTKHFAARLTTLARESLLENDQLKDNFNEILLPNYQKVLFEILGPQRRTHYELPTQFPEQPAEEDLKKLTIGKKGAVRAKYRSEAMAFILSKCGFQAQVETLANGEFNNRGKLYSEAISFAAFITKLARASLLENDQIKDEFKKILLPNYQKALLEIVGSQKRTHYEIPTQFPEPPAEEDLKKLTRGQKGCVRAKYRSEAMAFILSKCGLQAQVETTANSKLRKGVRSFSKTNEFAARLAILARESLLENDQIKDEFKQKLHPKYQEVLRKILGN